jgi:hypothetical protein
MEGLGFYAQFLSERALGIFEHYTKKNGRKHIGHIEG